MMNKFWLTSKRVRLGVGVFLIWVLLSGSPTTKTNNEKPEAKGEVTVSQVVTPEPQVEAISTSSAEERKMYEVVKVIDGDTLQVKVESEVQTIRLIGIDTPESVDPRKPVQCFAKEASDKAKNLLAGKKVSMESDESQGDKDKYNRYLRYVFFEDGTNFAQLMISEGYGHQYTYSKPYKYMEDFKQAEIESREAKRGLWADEACVTPETVTPSASTTKSTTPTPNITTMPIKVPTSSGTGYSCGTKTKCGEMKSCEEAKYFLGTCGVKTLDGDKDGTPCESLCN